MNIAMAPAGPRFDAPVWARLTRVGAALWRVTDADLRPLGHLRAVAGELGWVFHVERYDVRSRAFRVIGSFWTSGDAFDCLRYQR